MKPRKNRFLISAVSALLLAPAASLLVSSTAFAGNTWDGGGLVDDNWSTPANWDGPDTLPTYSSGLTFSGSTRLTPNNDTFGTTLGNNTTTVAITFASGSGAFTLGGNSITLSGNITNASTSLQTINLPLVLDANRQIATNAGPITLGGQISGSFSLIQAGTGGPLTLNTAGSSFNLYQINSGTTKLGVNDALPTTKGVTFATGASSGTLDLNGKTQTLGAAVTVAGSGGAGTVTISDTAGGGLLKMGGNVSQNATTTNTVTISAALDLNGSTRTFTLNNTNANFTVSGAISNSSGTAGLTKAGLGALTLSGANTFNGNTTVSNGLLILSNALALQNSTLDTTNSIASSSTTTGLKTTVTTLTMGGLSGNKNLASLFDSTNGYSGVTALTLNPATGQTPNFSGALTNGAVGMTLTKSGAGTQTLSGGAANTLSGAINVTGGTLAITKGADNVSSAKNMPGAITVASGATLSFDQAFTTAPDNNLTNALNLSGPGTSATVGALHLFGNATASGPITLDADTTITKSFNNGYITDSITGADKNLTLKTTLATQLVLAVSAPITLGTGGITVTGAGGTAAVTLSGANSYSGGTIITAGTLNYGNASALGSGGVSFTGNATLQAGVATTLANSVSVATGITGTVDTQSNATTLSGALTGDGNLTKTGTGTLTIDRVDGGDGDNTLSGAINVDAGTLSIEDLAVLNGEQSFRNMNGNITVASGATFNFSQNFTAFNLDNNITLSGAGTGGRGALNLWRNATATGTITLAADATISHNFSLATISGPITGTDKNLTLTTLTDGQGGMTVSGPITLGTGGVTVTGAANSGGFSINLSGNNDYSGETHVVSGTLMLSGSARIKDTATVRIDSGAVLHLDFAGSDTVGALYLPGDPNPKPNGTYGSLTSSATNKSANFAGDGILQVGAGGGSPYESWAGGALFADDANGDGVDNGLAWILGATDKNVSALNKLPTVAASGGFLTLNFSRVNPFSPAKLYVEYGTNLTGWTKLEIPALGAGTHPIGNGINVVVTSPGSPTPDTLQVKIPTTLDGGGGKLFTRLSATQN